MNDIQQYIIGEDILQGVSVTFNTNNQITIFRNEMHCIGLMAHNVFQGEVVEYSTIRNTKDIIVKKENK